MKKQNQPQKGTNKDLGQTQQNLTQEASEELMQEKGMQKNQKQNNKLK
ncbi:MAG: hypothetical protein ACOYVD_14980 [Bacillota bacterium]